MTITQGKKVVKQTQGDIVGVINDFNERVINVINSNNVYDKNNVPKFTGSGYIGGLLPGWETSTTTPKYPNPYFNNPEAIEVSQFDTKYSDNLTIPETTITAETLWEAMKNLTKNLNKIRKFTAYWYHNINNGSDINGRVLIDTIEGKGVFKSVLPDVTYGQDNYSEAHPYQKGTSVASPNEIARYSQFWTRSGPSTSPTLNPSKAINKNEVVEAGDMNTAIQNCYNEWADKCYNNNELVYTMYTCHLNCHSACHYARVRR